MKLAVLHYHLNRSGVTQVILNQLRALDQQCPPGERLSVALLYGGRRAEWPERLSDTLPHLDVTRHIVPELDYDLARPHHAALIDQLRTALRSADMPPHETVLHVHNHSVGKNVRLPAALRELAQEGYALLLQLHDFAEDFRPVNYVTLAAASVSLGLATPEWLYPQAPHIHYAVLNGRDAGILRQAGVDSSRLHLLPNAVGGIGTLPPREQARKMLKARFGIPSSRNFILYPVRGIRRKNLGEFLLWAVLAEHDAWFGLTLSPLNPRERSQYVAWCQLAAELELPIRWEVGGSQGLQFDENLAAADNLLTTSVAEGFGLVFLESWLAGKVLIGRDLPEISTDFVAAGMRYEHLRDRLLVPVDWIGETAFKAHVANAYDQACAMYGRSATEVDTSSTSLEHLIQDGYLDFADCGTQMQRKIVSRAAEDAASRYVLQEANPWLVSALLSHESDRETIAHNAETVRQQYSLATCGQRLWGILRELDACRRGGPWEPLANGAHILSSFLAVTRFRPLRTEQ